ncbi:MAG: phosphopantothenoylcysteine decarboxylase, partial [Myxococcota bacterium]
MRAVVTAGGTSELIDDVRVLTNLSSGRFGAAIANALAARGVEVTLLAGRTLATRPEWVDRAVEVVPFGGFAELDAALMRACESPPGLVFMAAAVSDYAPARTEGKIRSDLDELVLVLRRNPKLLGKLRGVCGPDTFLVGFKLLSGVTREELVQVAHHQVERDQLDLCVANDLQDLVGDRHPAQLVTPEGGAHPLDGTKAEVAAGLVSFALRRHQARRPRLAPVDGPASGPEPEVLAAARDAGGTGSWRMGDGSVGFPGGGRAWFG